MQPSSAVSQSITSCADKRAFSPVGKGGIACVAVNTAWKCSVAVRAQQLLHSPCDRMASGNMVVLRS